jgi:UDP-N-acetylglucosamine 2-epimerase
MADALQHTIERARVSSTILLRLELKERGYLLVTIHREENTDNLANLRSILSAFNQIEETVVFPVHPRTRKALSQLNGSVISSDNLRLIDPIGHLDLMRLAESARLVLTDSGGLQKEAYWLGVPCVTLRDETEWVETVRAGWNILTGARTEAIVNAISSFQPATTRPALYGNGQSALRISAALAASMPCSQT